jgi:hypothetical protein
MSKELLRLSALFRENYCYFFVNDFLTILSNGMRYLPMVGLGDSIAGKATFDRIRHFPRRTHLVKCSPIMRYAIASRDATKVSFLVVAPTCRDA